MKKRIALLASLLLLVTLFAACNRDGGELASSNWEGADGFYYSEDYTRTLEVVTDFGGPSWNLTFWDEAEEYLDGYLVVTDVDGNLLTPGDGITFTYFPEELPYIEVSGCGEYDGIYTLILG
ncbi:MAG: hypothetical protein IKU11_07630 [Clostridia bacterium]|nr:hypothetical protein [Clostridia bacterium]